MENVQIIELYKKGYSIDYIINEYYKSQVESNKFINLQTRRIILIEKHVNKRDVRGEVYKIIYSYLSKKDRPI